jgi:hypothetical protein
VRVPEDIDDATRIIARECRDGIAWPLGRIQSPFQPLLEDGIEGRRRLNGVKNARARINVGLNRIAGDDRLAKCVNGGGCQFVELRRCTESARRWSTFSPLGRASRKG